MCTDNMGQIIRNKVPIMLNTCEHQQTYASNGSMSLPVAQVPSGMQMPKECIIDIDAGCNVVCADRK